MNYEIVFGERALDRIPDTTPLDVIDCLDSHLRKLADDPTKLGRRACFPFPPKGQMYNFRCNSNGKRYYFVAFFYFGEDERTLCVYKVTHSVDERRR